MERVLSERAGVGWANDSSAQADSGLVAEPETGGAGPHFR